MPKEVQSAEDFSVDRIVITSTRFQQFIDIKNVAIELNIYEDIYMPFLTGSLMLLDDNSLFTVADFQGTEKLIIELSLPVDGAPTITKTFIMHRIDNIQKNNDNTSVILFSLIEDHGFYNNVQTFSRAYQGKGEEIIKNIANDKLGKNLLTQIKTFKNSYQSSFRLIVPNLNPFKAIKMVLDKISTENGSPYFLYSTINTNDLVLADLDTILQRPSFNAGEPFQYGQSVANDAINSILLQARAIYNLRAENQEDSLLLSELGAVGASFTTTDTTTGKQITYNHNINNVFQQLIDAGVISPDQDNILLDNSFRADPNEVDRTVIGDFDSRVFNLAGGGRTYPYQDNINNWTYESDPSAYKLMMYKYSISQLLTKNIQTIQIPGLKFLNKDIFTSVGNQIDLVIYKNEIVDDLTDPVDHKRSGRFVMTSKKHIFNIADESHTVVLSCSRLANRRIT